MGCWSCNPFCGKCKPPYRKAICPKCGKLTIVPKEKYLASTEIQCANCGEDITDLIYVHPVYCHFSELICAYPCGRKDTKKTELSIPCISNTPIETSRLTMKKMGKLVEEGDRK